MPSVTPHPRLAGLLAPAAALLLNAACSGSPAPAATSPTGGSPAAPAGPKVERLVVGVPGVGSSAETNVVNLLGSPDSWTLRSMYEQLIETDPKTGKYLPGLAQTWKLGADGKTISVTLRQGVQFHRDAGEFTAEDVAFSIGHKLTPESTSTDKTFYAGAKATSKYEADITLLQPLATWVYAISRENTTFMMSKAWFDKNGLPKSLNDPPLPGTSPYQWKEWAQGQRIVLERAPFKHWNVTPEFKELEFRIMKEPSTRLAAQLTGEVQMTTLPQDLQEQALKSGMAIARGTLPAQRAWMRFHGVYVDTKNQGQYVYPNSPLMSAGVRKALNKAINREELNKAFFSGKGEPLYNTPFHPTREGWNPDWEKNYKEAYGFDLRAAQQAVADAGYGAGKQLEVNVLLAANDVVSNAQDMQEAVAGYWRAAGIKVNLITMDPGQRIAQDRELKFDDHISLTSAFSDMFTGWQVYNSSIPPRFGAESWETDALFNKIRTEVDQAKREPMWRQLGDIAYGTYMNIPLFWLPAEVVINPKVVGEYTYPGNISGFWTHLEGVKAAK